MLQDLLHAGSQALMYVKSSKSGFTEQHPSDDLCVIEAAWTVCCSVSCRLSGRVSLQRHQDWAAHRGQAK